MTKIGYAILAVGALGLLLSLTGMEEAVTPLAKMHIHLYVWIAITVIGGAVAMFTRRTRD